MNTHQVTQEDKNFVKLSTLIKERQFDEAENWIRQFLQDFQIARTLHQITEQSTGLLTYTFVNYILQKHPSAFWHKIAASIASESLSVSQGHQAGFYHILKAIELDTNDYELKEFALGYYNKGLLAKEKARDFALQVLQYEPQNKLASRILAETSN